VRRWRPPISGCGLADRLRARLFALSLEGT
jgi:hypothetical protein